MRTFEVEVTQRVRITVNDENVIDRCVNNEPDEPGGKGWRDVYYDIRDAEDVVEMLGYNYVAHGRTVDRLDGWADLEESAVDYLEVGRAECWVTEL